MPILWEFGLKCPNEANGNAFKGMTLEMHKDAQNANSMIVWTKMYEWSDWKCMMKPTV